jgi:hypothetical protein
MSFISYYWNKNEIKDEVLKNELVKLVSESSKNEEKITAFYNLLNSNSSAAQGIVFDQYYYNNSLMRFGNENLFEECKNSLLLKARKQLKKKPIKSISFTGRKIPAANYASACGILALLGVEDDIELITPILSKFLYDEEIVSCLCQAARNCTRNSKKNHLELLNLLSIVILSGNFSTDVRNTAVNTIANFYNEDVEKILIKTVNSALFSTNVIAAICLAENNLEKNRHILENLVNRLPDKSHYLTSELVELLEV